MNSPLAFQAASAIKLHQEQLLQKQLHYVAAHSPYYQKLFAEHAIAVSSIKTIEDFKQIPFTTKDDFANANEAFLAASAEQIIDYCTTSGTTGNPVYIALTENDLERLAYNEFRSFQTAGITAKDSVQLLLTLDKQFMAGMAYYLGLRKVGCAIVRSGPGSAAMQIDAIIRHRVNVLVAVPSFILRMKEYAKANRITLNDLGIEKIICIGEAIRQDDLSPNILAQKITADWDVQLFGTYASTEMQTAFTEDEHGDGFFLQPELLIAEIVDEEGHEVNEDETGELVITHLGVEGSPLLRYKTGDICRKHSGISKGGRNALRIGSVIGRKNQLIKLNGTTLYPNAIMHILKEYDLDDFLIVVEKSALETDDVKILITSSKAVHFESMIQQMQNRLRVKPVIIQSSKAEIDELRPKEARKIMQILFR